MRVVKENMIQRDKNKVISEINRIIKEMSWGMQRISKVRAKIMCVKDWNVILF